MQAIPLSQIIRLLLLVMFVQVVFNLGLYFLQPVPLIVIGIGQLLPAVLVGLFAKSYRPSLARLFTRAGNVKLLLAACLGTAFIVLICSAVAVVYSGNVQLISELPKLYPFAFLLPELSVWQFILFLFVIAPFFHLFNAAGEEIFWRGYLLDGLSQNFSQSTAVLLTGLCWGIWHIPMVVLLNWVFGQAILGSVLFTVSMITWGYAIAYLRLHSQSLWPAIVMHATANAFVIGCYDSIAVSDNNIYTSPWGLLGITLTLPIAVLIHRRLLTRELQPC